MLTTDKSKKTYDEMFNTLLRLQPNFKPNDFMLDFEKAAMLSINGIFKEATVHGCFFHFSQNVWRRIQNVGLQTVYAEDEDFAFNLRLLVALAFLPPNDIVNAFEELLTTDFFNEDVDSEYSAEIQNLVTYFQSTYVFAIDRRGRRKNPLYPVELWSVHANTLAGN